MNKLLLIDDDAALTELLSDYLHTQGFAVRSAGDGVEGMRMAFHHHPDIVVLDVTMPHRDGWETLERLRELTDLPVIMLTAKGEESDILRGFALGADDYVTKPFSFAQLSARVQAVLARSERSGVHNDEMRLKQGQLEVDLGARRVWHDGQPIALTPTEFKLLVALMRRAGEVMAQEELVSEVWGKEYAGEIGHVRRYVWHLRRKIEPDIKKPRYIHNERGFGYRFQAIG